MKTVIENNKPSVLAIILKGGTGSQVEHHAPSQALVIRCDDDFGIGTALWQEAQSDADSLPPKPST